VVADEYYMADRHPTCQNFRSGSARILADWLPLLPVDSVFCEVGAGKSIVAEQFMNRGLPLDRLWITDQSNRMLDYSRHFEAKGANLLVTDADKLPFTGDSVACVVSSLGDPYNLGAFWTEVARVLTSGGIAIFTLPSYDWARHYRGLDTSQSFREAEFELIDGRRVFLPSFIHPESRQRELINQHGLRVIEVRDVAIEDLQGQALSPKLGLERGPNGAVVTGYLLQKPMQA
jgi:SAM-dependent methyltransferase